MRYGFTFLLLTAVLAVAAVLLGGVGWLLLWPALSFGLVGSAYLGLGPRVFGKRSDGTLAPWSVLVLLPYLLPTWLTWHLLRLSREPCWHEVRPGLYVGRRPLPGELPDGVSLVVDLTAEFAEPRGVRAGRAYVSLPTLDTGTADAAAFRTLVHRIVAEAGGVYVHCAQGHGRTGMVAAAVLLAEGRYATAEAALAALRAVRPGIALSPQQAAFVARLAANRKADPTDPSDPTDRSDRPDHPPPGPESPAAQG